MRYSDWEFFAVVICSLLAWQLIWQPVRFKMRTRIAVHPKLRPTLLDQLPRAVQQYLQKVTSDLASEGFTLAANMTTPRFGTGLSWMQALFINRKTSDLASVFRLSTRYWESVTFIFTTQFKSGERVLTTDVEIAGHVQKWRRVDSEPQRLNVRQLYETHRSRVAGVVPKSPIRMIPREGAEPRWMEASAAFNAASYLKRGYFKEKEGVWYRPTWEKALRETWPRIWLIGPLLGSLLRSGSPRGDGYGFEMTIRAESVAPVANDEAS